MGPAPKMRNGHLNFGTVSHWGFAFRFRSLATPLPVLEVLLYKLRQGILLLPNMSNGNADEPSMGLQLT